MDIKIKKIEECDYENVISASAEEGWTTYSSRRGDFYGAVKNSAFIVAYAGDEFAGYARAISDGFITTFLCELLVVKKFRNVGIGGMLVMHIHAMFPKTRVDLISEADGFYIKQNFRAIGTGFRKSVR